MKQYGDITKLNGAELDPVDLIVGGSPCQDLSVAGKRAGLEGERSGLFMEMIRIIKEMRNATNFIRPRYALWENVPGAFSSNKGADFRAVLTEFVRVAEPDAPDVPMPKKKWDKSGVLLGSGWSIAYRTFDAQYWGKTIRDSRTGDVLAMGTPQRRRRIALVADFRGQTAPQILFELSCLPGNPPEESEEGKGIAGDPSESIGRTSEPMLLESNQNHATIQTDGICTTLSASMGMGGGYVPMVTEPVSIEQTIYGIDLQGGKGAANYTVNVAPTLASDSHGTPHAISFQERCGKPGGG